MTTITFSKWAGPDGIEQFIINQTGCKPYSGAGINPRIEKKTTIVLGSKLEKKMTSQK